MLCLSKKGVMSKNQLAEYTEKSIRTLQNKLNNLIKLKIKQNMFVFIKMNDVFIH